MGDIATSFAEAAQRLLLIIIGRHANRHDFAMIFVLISNIPSVFVFWLVIMLVHLLPYAVALICIFTKV